MKKNFFGIAGIACAIILAGSCSKTDTPAIDSSTAVIDELVAGTSSSWDEQEVYADEATQTIYMDNCGIPADFSFTECLRGLSLSETQLPQVQQSLRKYEACSDRAMKRIRAIYNELKEKYRTKYQRLWNAYQDGTITSGEFRERVAALRVDFKAELRRMNLDEKLGDALLICLRECLTELHTILDERQWNAFIDCYSQL